MDLRNLFGLKKPDVKKLEREKDLVGLMKLLKFENDEDVRRDAAFAIGKITDPKSELYTSHDETHEELGLEGLITALKDENQTKHKEIVKSLVEIGEPAVEPLIHLLEDGKWRVRYYAAEALGEIGDATAVEPLIKSLNDENNGVRSNSIIALVEIGKPSLNPLINALDDDKWQLRWNAAETLGEIGDTTAVKPLIKILKDPNPWVRKTAAGALGNIGDRSAFEALTKILDDEDPDVRNSAAGAIEKIGNT